MSSCIDNDLEFHGTKKGGTRKTVSRRKAYVDTPMALAKKLAKIANDIDAQRYKMAYSSSVQLAEKLSGKKLYQIKDYGYI